MVFLKEYLGKVDFEKKSADNKTHATYPACKELKKQKRMEGDHSVSLSAVYKKLCLICPIATSESESCIYREY